MTFAVTAGNRARPPVSSLCTSSGNLRAGLLGPLKVTLNIFNNQVTALCFRSADFVRLGEQVIEIRLAHRSEHHHAVAIRHLGVDQVAVFIGSRVVGFKPKGFGKPGDGSRQVAVPHQRYDPRRLNCARTRHSQHHPTHLDPNPRRSRALRACPFSGTKYNDPGHAVAMHPVVDYFLPNPFRITKTV